MLDIRWIRENPEKLAQALAKRGQSSEAARSMVDDLIARDDGLAQRGILPGLLQRVDDQALDVLGSHTGRPLPMADEAILGNVQLEPLILKGDTDLHNPPQHDDGPGSPVPPRSKPLNL